MVIDISDEESDSAKEQAAESLPDISNVLSAERRLRPVPNVARVDDPSRRTLTKRPPIEISDSESDTAGQQDPELPDIESVLASERQSSMNRARLSAQQASNLSRYTAVQVKERRLQKQGPATAHRPIEAHPTMRRAIHLWATIHEPDVRHKTWLVAAELNHRDSIDNPMEARLH